MDYDIECIILDEYSKVNIMIEITCEIMGRPAMIPYLEKIGFFKGKMVTLCQRITLVPISINGISTKE